MSRIVDEYFAICQTYLSGGYDAVRNTMAQLGCEDKIRSLEALRAFLSERLPENQRTEFEGAFRLEELLST